MPSGLAHRVGIGTHDGCDERWELALVWQSTEIPVVVAVVVVVAAVESFRGARFPQHEFVVVRGNNFRGRQRLVKVRWEPVAMESSMRNHRGRREVVAVDQHGAVAVVADVEFRDVDPGVDWYGFPSGLIPE